MEVQSGRNPSYQTWMRTGSPVRPLLPSPLYLLRAHLSSASCLKQTRKTASALVILGLKFKIRSSEPILEYFGGVWNAPGSSGNIIFDGQFSFQNFCALIVMTRSLISCGQGAAVRVGRAMGRTEDESLRYIDQPGVKLQSCWNDQILIVKQPGACTSSHMLQQLTLFAVPFYLPKTCWPHKSI